MTPLAPVRAPRRGVTALIALALAALAAFALWPGLAGGFLRWDDDRYVTENPRVRAGITAGGAAWALTAHEAGNWHPLTWLSHMADVTLFGLDPRGHHATSLALHAANAALLFLALQASTGARWRSACVAALFAVHPLRAESVAWVSERKDVLAALFTLLALLAYRRQAARPSRRGALAVAALLALALAAKQMAVTLPLVLVLLDGWPLARFGRPGTPGWLRRSLADKVPLFALALAGAAIALAAQRGAMAPLEPGFAGRRLANAAVSYARYLGKAVDFRELTPLDLLPADPWPAATAVASVALLAVASALALRAGRRRPYLLVGWLWFLVMLLPVVGLVQVGRQGIADRYTYLPLVGIGLAACWGGAEAVAGRPRLRAAAGVGAALVVALLAARCRWQAALWRDELTLFGHAVRLDPGNWEMRNNLGTALADAGRLPEALEQFRRSAALAPAYPKAWYNLGHALELQGRFEEAVGPLGRALSLRPDYAAARRSLGAALLELGRDREAAGELEQALRLEPGDAGAAVNLGLALQRLGDVAGAARRYREALGADPGNEPARRALAALGERP